MVDDPSAAHLVGSSWACKTIMNWRIYTLLFVLGLGVALGVASLQSLPGYLDSDYYFVGGLQLVEGKGFTEPFLWNYLDDPAGLPHPSHTYWLPLSSILAALSMFVTGQHTYAAARLVFILIAACIPPLTARLALDITGRRGLALTSGLLAVFSVYYVPFLPVTDNYAPFMLLGGLIFLLVKKERWWAFLLMGLLAGLMNLARSDGLLWLGLLGLLALWQSAGTDRPVKNKIQSFVISGCADCFGLLPGDGSLVCPQYFNFWFANGAGWKPHPVADELQRYLCVPSRSGQYGVLVGSRLGCSAQSPFVGIADECDECLCCTGGHSLVSIYFDWVLASPSRYSCQVGRDWLVDPS